MYFFCYQIKTANTTILNWVYIFAITYTVIMLYTFLPEKIRTTQINDNLTYVQAALHIFHCAWFLISLALVAFYPTFKSHEKLR